MNAYIPAIVGTFLTIAACEKPVHYDQYYTVEYNQEGYLAHAWIFENNKPAYLVVSMNGEQGLQGGPDIGWSGDGYPDIKFSMQLEARAVFNNIIYADAPVYNLYMPDTFSRSKGAWFVFNQTVPVAGEREQLVLGDYIHSSMALYTSDNIPNDTVWAPLADSFYAVRFDSAFFQFVVSKELPLQQPDGTGKGNIEVRKVFKKWVQLTP